MLHIVDRGTTDPSRFGFIVAKSVGGAVVRNVVRRRLRAVCRDILPSIPLGNDVVIRALPGSEAVDWTTLHTEIAAGIDRGVRRG
jgi:ribonuclease P protein component